jgi:type I restriction enzyme S subunit
MMAYETKTIRDVTDTLIDYRGKTPPKTASGVKLITAKVIKDGFIVDGDHEYIANEHYDAWMRRGLPHQWDILLTTEAPLGEVAQLRTPEKVALAQRVILLRGDPSKINQNYFFQALKSPFVQAGLRARSTGTTVLGIKQSELWQVEVPCPSISIQERISSILFTFDSLIENNVRRIRILEEMAQLIYREWFVKFRFPGHNKVKMVQSEIGVVPAGWCQPYPDYVDYLEGPGLRKWEFRDRGIPFLNVRNLIEHDIDTSKSHCVDVEMSSVKYRHFLLAEGDHVVSSSGTLGRIATVRKRHLPVMLNTGIIRMRAKTDALGKWQIKHFLQSEYFQKQIRALAMGVAQIHFGPLHLKQMKVVVPPLEIGRQYEALVDSLEGLLCNLVERNHTLRATRDSLLPKLVSGEIRVEQFEYEVVSQGV